MAVLMMDTAYCIHLQGRTTQNKPPVFDISRKINSNIRRDRQKIMSFPIPFKICLDQSMISANMQVPQIMDKVQIALLVTN